MELTGSVLQSLGSHHVGADEEVVGVRGQKLQVEVL